MRELTSIAAAILECAEAWEPWARLIGNVRADEVAVLARAFMALDADIQPPDAREAEALILCRRAVEAREARLQVDHELATNGERHSKGRADGDAHIAAVAALKALEEDHA